MNRSGTEQGRFLLNRFRHVVNRGWYVESREGMLGPFILREEAVNLLEQHKKIQLSNEYHLE